MPELIATASRVTAASTPPKTNELVGRVNTGTARVSVATAHRAPE